MTRMAKNRHGNVDIPEVLRSKIGSKKHPIVVHRGDQADIGTWFATLRGLPGYLGMGATPGLAIDGLWQMIGDGPIYDVSSARNLEPTRENIRKYLEREVRKNAAKQEAISIDAQKDSQFTVIAGNHKISRNALTQSLSTSREWDRRGGLEKFIRSLGPDHWDQTMAMKGLEQEFLELHPERAAFVLARAKFPKPDTPRLTSRDK